MKYPWLDVVPLARLHSRRISTVIKITNNGHRGKLAVPNARDSEQ
jgi:hypothetical protein